MLGLVSIEATPGQQPNRFARERDWMGDCWPKPGSELIEVTLLTKQGLGMGTKEIDLIMVQSLTRRGFEPKSAWHWRKILEVGAIDFWPTSGKLRWLGKTWVGGLEAVDKILSTGGQRMPDDLKEPEPRSTDSEDEGVWITIGADCPWNPTPGIRHLFHFKDEVEANAARMGGFVGVPEAVQNGDDDSWLNFPNNAGMMVRSDAR